MWGEESGVQVPLNHYSPIHFPDYISHSSPAIEIRSGKDNYVFNLELPFIQFQNRDFRRLQFYFKNNWHKIIFLYL